jgi:hypothetical protein
MRQYVDTLKGSSIETPIISANNFNWRPASTAWQRCYCVKECLKFSHWIFTVEKKFSLQIYFKMVHPRAKLTGKSDFFKGKQPAKFLI